MALVLTATVVALIRSGSRSDDAVVVDDPEPPIEHRVAVADDAVRPPGSTLASGIEVQPGSGLVWSSFPLIGYLPVESYDPEDPPDRVQVGWQAVVLVDGDPIEVWNSYASLFDIERGDAVSTCIATAVPLPTPTPNSGPTTDTSIVDTSHQPARRFLTEDRLDGEDRLDCHVLSSGVVMTMAVGVAPCFDQHGSPCSAHAISHLRIRVYDDPTTFDPDQRGTDDLRFERALPASHGSNLPKPIEIPGGPVIQPAFDTTGRSVLPQAGERLDDGTDGFLRWRPVRWWK